MRSRKREEERKSADKGKREKKGIDGKERRGKGRKRGSR